MKKKISKSTRLLRLCSILILIPILLLSACNKNDKNPAQTTTQAPEPARLVTVDELSREIKMNASPPLETREPGIVGILPVECLKQAPQDIVGERIQFSFADLKTNFIVFRYNATTKQLVIMNDNSEHFGDMMLVMQAECTDMKDFLSQTDSWTGTVTAVKIVDMHDVMFSSNSLHGGSITANETSTICYGIISSDKGIVTYDAVQPKEKFAEAFERSLARFGIE